MRSLTAPLPVPRRSPERTMTLGVEEEFLLLDPDTGAVRPVVDEVVAALPEDVRACSRLEFRAGQLELATPVCTDLADLRNHLAYQRRVAARAAHGIGVRLTAVGATPLPDAEPELSHEDRYAEMARRYGAIAGDPGVCGCHVHVGLADRELAVQVSNHLRLWLPVVQALVANSPLHDGRDTGYASWRSVQFLRWPSTGPTPYFASAGAYDATVRRLIDSGVMMDEAMVYWYARLSASFPTIEIRVGDVCPTVGEAVLTAGLVRALVVHAVTEVGRGVRAPAVPESLVSAAHWRAAHEGLDGALVDLRGGTVRPAWAVVDDLVALVRPALVRLGDRRTVSRQLALLRRYGNGATRQRRLLRRTGDIRAVLAAVAQETAGGR